MLRLPIRLKLTLAFAAVMAVVLAATGLFVYVRLGSELDRSLKQSLQARAGDVTALVSQADSGLRESGGNGLTRRGEGFAQILAARGNVIDATLQAGRRPLLSPRQLADALRGTMIVDTIAGPVDARSARLLATPVQAQGQRLVVVVGSSLENRRAALNKLAGLMALGGLAALILASLAGYGVASAALRPVESMRRRAAAISAGEPGQRLPVPPVNDEVGRLGVTLNAMLGRIEEAFARERAFVSDASHELRSPLAILKTELELALRAGRSPAQLRDAVASAAGETDRLAQLAEDLLVIARSDQGGLPIRAQEVRVGELFVGTRERFARRATEQDAALTVHDAGELTVHADALRVEQALGNLVENALRHGRGSISLGAVARDSAIELHVRDEGDGFPSDFLPTAFERFSRGDGARGRGGTGLGLAIVAAIAAAHGGSAHAANHPGGGADVWLSLPVL